jgi:hypothetical protein
MSERFCRAMVCMATNTDPPCHECPAQLTDAEWEALAGGPHLAELRVRFDRAGGTVAVSGWQGFGGAFGVPVRIEFEFAPDPRATDGSILDEAIAIVKERLSKAQAEAAKNRALVDARTLRAKGGKP